MRRVRTTCIAIALATGAATIAGVAAGSPAHAADGDPAPVVIMPTEQALSTTATATATFNTSMDYSGGTLTLFLSPYSRISPDNVGVSIGSTQGTVTSVADSAGTRVQAVFTGVSIKAGASVTFTVTAKSGDTTDPLRGPLNLDVVYTVPQGGTDTDVADTLPGPGVDNSGGEATLVVPKSTPYKAKQVIELSRASNKTMYYTSANQQGGGTVTTVPFGSAGDSLLTGDLLGSGDSYPVDFRSSNPSQFYAAVDFLQAAGGAVSPDPAYTQAYRYGTNGDIGLTGSFPITTQSPDYAFGSTDTVAIYRPSAHTFYVDGGDGKGVGFGSSGDIPLVGNWTGTQPTDPSTGKPDQGGASIGVYRPSNHTFYLLTYGANGKGTVITRVFGAQGDTPIVGDWDGSGTTLVGVKRGNTYYLCANNMTGQLLTSFAVGSAGDVPHAAYALTGADMTALAAADTGSSDQARQSRTADVQARLGRPAVQAPTTGRAIG